MVFQNSPADVIQQAVYKARRIAGYIKVRQQMKLGWLFAAICSCTTATAGDLPSCDISVYHLNDAGAVGSEPFIQPRHVLKVEPFKDVLGDIFPEFTQWLVTLNSEGAEINRGYTSRNLGAKVAIYCDGREVSRPVIRSVMRDQFVFGVRKGDTP